MHTIKCNIKSVGDNQVSYPGNLRTTDLMSKVAVSIEQLDIQIYEILSAKSKLDQIFSKLAACEEGGTPVSLAAGAKINQLGASIENSSYTSHLQALNVRSESLQLDLDTDSLLII